MPANKRHCFKVSPRLLAPLGLEQLQDPALAVLELIKNAWDADSTRVWVEVEQRGATPTIAVRDNGAGMTRDQFSERWLVIGASYKRGQGRSPSGRPFIGEKGLGRLASYALGSLLTIQSSPAAGEGFVASIDWDAFFQSPSVEEYEVTIGRYAGPRGTAVIIGGLRSRWEQSHTDLLATYTQFLTSVPGQKFAVVLKIDGKTHPLDDPLEAVSKIAEAELDMVVRADGTPVIANCKVDGRDYSWVPFRDFRPRLIDSRLAGSTLRLRFYRRDKAAQRLSRVLRANEVNDLLDRYQGIRIYRDGINVPPYGLNGDDWAALEKQRTATGGPTMVPGNSQLTGELHVPGSARHLVVTAGRSGFSDQHAVSGLAEYVRWAVRELGTARRARELGIRPGEGVPSRVDQAATERNSGSTGLRVKKVLAEVAREEVVRRNPEFRAKLEHATNVIEDVLDRNEATLRLYAQLASTGIAATSFAHELRADFDVVSEAVGELVGSDEPPDQELLSLLSGSWQRITNFVALFRMLPIKVRRKRTVMSQSSLRTSLEGVSKLVPADRVAVAFELADIRVRVVPAELDAILLNLISNSVKAIAESPRSEAGRIRVRLRASGADFELRVADNGCGIPSNLRPLMFEPLEGKFAEGTGMGLAIVRFIAERYEGGVTVVETPPAGFSTEILVTLRGVVG